MIHDLIRYPEMKDSGVPWLGEVPKHWDVPRLGSLLRERGETNDRNFVTEVLSVTRDRGVIPYAEKGNIGNKKSDDITRYKIVRPDDIVVNCMNVIIGSVGLSKYTGCLSPVYYVLTRRSDDNLPSYLDAYFQTKPFQLSLVRIGNGILAHRMRIPMELLKCEPFPRPPAAEQAAIVQYLDYMDRHIGHYVRCKQKLIKLLDEQKIAIIRNAVTRGRDLNVQRKSSNISWIDDIPVHWDVRKARSLFRMQGSGTTPNADRYYGGGVPWVMSGDLNDSQIVATKRDVTRNAVEEISTLRLYPQGSLVVAMYGATIGKTGILGIAACTNQACCVLADPTSDANVAFMQFAFQVARQHLLHLGYGGGQPNINAEIVKSLRLPCPPRAEQDEIVQFIDGQCKSLDAAVGQAKVEISLLHEYRNRLTADVVTGKFDVRAAVAGLPNEINQEEMALDEMEPFSEDGLENDDSDLESSSVEVET